MNRTVVFGALELNHCRFGQANTPRVRVRFSWLPAGLWFIYRNFNEGFRQIGFRVNMKWFSRGKNTDTDSTFTCKYCNMKFEEEEKMKRHARKAHSEKGGDLPNFNPFGGT
jgi:hypothetical protein